MATSPRQKLSAQFKTETVQVLRHAESLARQTARRHESTTTTSPPRH